MTNTMTPASADRDAVAAWMSDTPNHTSVIEFVSSENIKRLNIRFDKNKLRTALDDAAKIMGYDGKYGDAGFATMALTRRPGQDAMSDNDLSGRFYTRTDYSYTEQAREDIVDEGSFSEFEPALKGTYFKHVYDTLSEIFILGRVRVQKKSLYNCNSWHRDPEPRLHIPIISNPGSLFIVNHHCTHLPADGSVYFTDTRGYHTALNGGESERTHIVAALVGVR